MFDYIFGFGGNPVLHAMVRPIADELCVRRAITGADKRRTWKALRYGAKSWGTQRRMVARIEATTLGLDIRYVVTSLRGTAKYLYETVYCDVAGRELHQAAQGPARLRSHFVSRSTRQPIALNLAHRCLLAPEYPARPPHPSARCGRGRNSTRCVCV